MEHNWEAIDPKTGETVPCDGSCETLCQEFHEYVERRQRAQQASGIEFLDEFHQQEFSVSRHGYHYLLHGAIESVMQHKEPNLMDFNRIIELALFLEQRKSKLDAAAKELEALVGVSGPSQGGQTQVQQ